jgi:hypothetical protein
MNSSLKTRETRCRRILHRRGLALGKSRARDPAAIGFGRYRVFDPWRHHLPPAAAEHALTLGEIEAGIEAGVVGRWRWPDGAPV